MMNHVVSLGSWLRSRRRALDLTQEELARRVGCAVITIRKLEADERRPSREMASRIADELGLTADENAAFVKVARQQLRADRLAPAPAPQGPTTLVPPHAPTATLIGRRAEVDAIKHRLLASTVRLVTLTGAGGTGKTRLAIQAAQEVTHAFPDGVCVVSLAPINKPSLVLLAIAQALGIVEITGQALPERVLAQLRRKRSLLVLDNFEHVLEAAPLITELLRGCPDLKILVTSRARLRLTGEHAIPVEPLPVPRADGREAKEAAQNEAVRLFTERAQAANPQFTLTEMVTPVVADICRRLDGLPLAIELAAARCTVLSPGQLLTRLESRFELLVGGPRDLPARQRTMQATIDWSHDLLNQRERALFRRLAVFAGGWTLEAVDEVCGIEAALDTLGTLSSLVDQGLVRREGQPVDEGRFVMLDTLREYARHRLDEAGETELLRSRHAGYYLSVAEGMETELRGPQQLERLERLESEHDNLREALSWSVTGTDVERSYRLVGALWPFWFLRGHFYEWNRWWDQLPRPSSADRSGSLRPYWAKVLLGRAFLAHYEVDPVQATALGEESLRLCRQTCDQWGVAASLVIVGAAGAGYAGDKTGMSRLRDGVARARDINDPWLLAWSLQALGDVLGRARVQYVEASAVLQESVDMARRVGDSWLTARGLLGLAQMLRLQHIHQHAAALAGESMTLYQTLGDKLGVAWSLHELGDAAYVQQDYWAARSYEGERLATERALANPRGIWHSLWSLERVELELGFYEQTLALSEESLALARELGEPWRIVLSLCDSALGALLRHDVEQAAVMAREAVSISEDVSYAWVRASALWVLAWTQYCQGERGHAGVYFIDALELERDGGNKRGIAECLEGVAASAAAQGRTGHAARFLSAAGRLRLLINTPRRPSESLLCGSTLQNLSSSITGGPEPDAKSDDDELIEAAISQALAHAPGRTTDV